MEAVHQSRIVNRPAAQPAAAAPVRAPTPALTVQLAGHVSSPHDPAEREAEQTARRVMRAPDPTPAHSGFSSPSVARFADTGVYRVRKEEEKIQRQARAPAPRVSPMVSAEIQSSMGGGSPLPNGVRAFMEPRFRADFGGVRVHGGPKAAQLSAALGARAFTVGNHVFFGKDQLRPDSEEGRELIAHELTHTVQQGAVSQDAPVRRSEDPRITTRSQLLAQRLGIGDALDYFARHANNIPGFRMFTIVLGVNPINMSRVDRSAANILRAVVEILPGGALITRALDNYGVFDRVGTWVEEQIRSLGLTGSAIRDAISRFLDSLSWRDIFRLGDVWERARRIFTEPIDRLFSFVRGLAAGILRFVKDAILRPLAGLFENTRGYPLLKAVLGFDPITGDAVPRNAETLIGGFMRLIGQEEVWTNIQRGNAIGRAWAWFQGALGALMGFVRQIPQLFLGALAAFQISDIVDLPAAFGRVVSLFGDFAGRFVSWAGGTVLNLLEIIFEVVAPGAMVYLRRAAGAFATIVRDPIRFVGNLVRAAMLGFRQFASNILRHLRGALIGWLTGAMSGANIYIPAAFNLREILKFVLSVLGLTWQNIRAKLVRAVGETAVRVLETGFDIVLTLVTEGPAAAWQKIVETLSNLQQMVIDGVMNFVRDRVVQAAVTRLLGMLSPAGAFIQAIIATYNTVMFFVERLRQIVQVAMAFIDSIAAIAAGSLAAAATRVEQTMAGLLTLVISFLARIAGLGRVADAVTTIINRVRQPIDRALDRVVEWIVTQARRLGRMVSNAARDLLGRLFRRRPIAAGSRSHNTWLTPEGDPMVASRVMPLADRIADWRTRVRDLAEDQQGRARQMLDQAHTLRVTIGNKSREVVRAQRAQDEATIRARQPEIEAAYTTLVGVLQQLFLLFEDAQTPRGAAMDTRYALAFNAYDREVLPLKRGRPQLVTGSPVTIYSQFESLWNRAVADNETNGWAFPMAHGLMFQLERVLESARRVGTSQYPQLTGVEVRIPPYRRGTRTMQGTRVDYTVRDQASVKSEVVDVGVEVKRYGTSWDSAKVDREIGKIRRQLRAAIFGARPQFDVVRLEIGGYDNTPDTFRRQLHRLLDALRPDADARKIKLELREL